MAIRPLLFTSVPPSQRGEGLDAADRSAPQAAKIHSWIEAGFRPVSVHLSSEIGRYPWLPEALRASGVECAVVDADRTRATSAQLCPIIDLLRAIGSRTGGCPFALINADIRIAGPAGDGPAAMTDRLAHDEFLVAQRTDVAATANGVREAVFPHGFDFVALHPRWIESVLEFLSPSLTFGRPWWDHYLPLALIACGLRPRLVEASWCQHDIHANKWDWRQYCSIGTRAMCSFRAAAECRGFAALVERWTCATAAEFGPLMPARGVGVLRSLALHGAAPGFVKTSFLKRQAAAHMTMILRLARAPASPTEAVRDSQASP